MTTTCPWADWAQMPARFCEESLCAWIRQPGNTWSNVAFIVAGLAIWRATSALDQRRLRPMAWILMAMGIGSGFFHASETRVGEWLDYGGMYLMSAFMATTVLRRAILMSRAASLAIFWALFAIGMSSLFVGGAFVRGAFEIASLACPIGEAFLFARRATRARSYRWFLAAYAVFVPALVLWALDEHQVLCDPANHVISGHAVWHVLDALMFWLSYRYYRQFDVLRAR